VRKVLAAAVAVLLLAGCGTSGGANSTKLTGTSADIMTALLAEVAANLPANSAPITEQVPLAAEQATAVGLTATQFTDQVTDGTISRAMILTFAHEVVLIHAKDAAAATQLATAMPKAYDPAKWVCVFPEQAFVVQSGPYVLLVASTKQYADAASAAFTKLAGTTGAVNTFYTGTK